ncbi:Major Facilitator Superfamily protein [Cladophialophora carrionii]|uniref:Major Facilitator Superfamily protein n=1 Tax=Cladophialophora carrionii TaxID=86049 RepID=A0A1C1CSH5_9EURO|nr:Major Facilitator Superfamily protein [Cladophialophora carrionii]
MIVYTYRKIRAYRARKAAEAKDQAQVQAGPNAGSHSPYAARDIPLPPKAPTAQPCPQCAQEKSKARKYRWKLLLSLTPAFFVASLDLTIVATALPQIASHFDKFNQLNWIVTAFTLTSTAFIPVFGQLADTFGRHATLQFSVVLLAIGSVLCAAAPDWAVLLLGRALQGIGTAGISNVVMIILADLVSLREQAINTSIFQLLNGIGYRMVPPGVGPVIGGYLTNSNWRYCFVLCAGVSVLSIVGIFLLRNDLKPGKVSVSRPPVGQSRLQILALGLSTLDYGGICLFILGVGLLVLGTAWGGSTYPWSSGAVLSSLTLGSIFFILFLVYEMLLSNDSGFLARRLPRGTAPMIPSSILRSKDVSLVCAIAFSTGAAIYSVFYFIGIYFTLVEAFDASDAGTQLLYYVPGIGVGVYLAIFICNVHPRQTFPPLLVGTIIETAGIAALAYAVKARNETLVNVMMAVAGAGTGMRFMPSNLHLAGMFRDRLAPVFSILRFAMPFGGTLALTIMGSVFQNQMSEYFGAGAAAVVIITNATTSNSPGGATSFNLHTQASLDLIDDLPAATQEAIRAQGATATMWAFISILPILACSLLASLFLGNVWISKKKKNKSEVGTETETETQAEEQEQERGEKAESIRADGLCKRHAPVGTDGPADVEEGEEQRNQVEFVSQVYLLAVMRGDVKRLKTRGAAAEAKLPAVQALSEEETHLPTRLHEGGGTTVLGSTK